jgi:hypothetical protein
VKELCEGPSLNRSLETLASLSRGIGSSSYKDRASVCVWNQEPPKGSLRHQGDQVVSSTFD